MEGRVFEPDCYDEFRGVKIAAGGIAALLVAAAGWLVMMRRLQPSTAPSDST